MTLNERKELIQTYLGKTVRIEMDRPIGFVHSKEHYDLVYPINYGYIPGVLGGDGEELDVYLLGVTEPVKEYTAVIIGAACRSDDCEDKLIAAPAGMRFTSEEMAALVHFQEQYYHTRVFSIFDEPKHLYLIGGTMGVGKTTACQSLKRLLPRSVFLDGDWCWDADPFIVNEETKKMVQDNITHLLQNFLDCSLYQNIIFCWVMHEQSIIDSILSSLNTAGCKISVISLVCNEEALRSRLQKDIDTGVRSADIIERSIARLPLYNALTSHKLDVSSLSPEKTAEELKSL